jgi:hypothetical protein
MIKCKVQQYDPSVTESPFEFIDLFDLVFEHTKEDSLSFRMKRECERHGRLFKFYTSSDTEDYNYIIVVHGSNEEIDVELTLAEKIFLFSPEE